MFARAVVRERKMPFEISSPKREITREESIKAFMSLRAQAKEIAYRICLLMRLMNKFSFRDVEINTDK